MSEDYSNNIINNDNNNIINDNNNISNDNNNQSKLKSLGDEIRTVMEISIGKKPESIREAELQEKNKQIAEEIRKKLRIDTNPLIPNLETIDNNINQLEQLKEKLSNNPLTQYTNIDTNKINKSIEYLNTSKNNSAHNIIKNGTDNTTVLYKDNNNQTKAIDLTGEELITEDTDNIYIDDVIIPKHTTKTQTLQDIYTKQELAKLKQTNPNYRPMTDSEWLEEINKEREYNYSLNKTLTKEMSILANDIPQDLKAEIDYLDPLGIDEYMFLTAKMKKLQPIIEIASDKLNAKQTITKEEYEALQTARYITYSMQSRGISTRARIIPGAIQMGKDSLIGALVMFTTDWLINAGIGLATYATGGLTAPIASIRAVQQIRKYSKIFNNARKKYKVLKYTWNTGKLIGYQMAGAKLDTISRTFLFDVMPFLGENREQRITAKRNNQMLEFTDKGGLFINDISQDMEDFLERQDDVEQYDEALGERIVAPLLRPIINAFPIPSNIANSIFAKAIKKINNFPRIAGTSFDGILEEHAEEVFTSILNHLRKANDPNTTLGQTLTEYFNPKNFTINTINMMISGGIIKALHPTFSENKDNSQTQSLNRATVKTYFKNLFNKNPNLILNDNNNVNNINNNNNNNTSNNNNTLGSIDQYNYKNIIDNLPETEIDKLAKDIYKKDEEQLEAKYQEQKNNLKNNLISSGITETEANNLIKLFEGNYENLARSLGVSKSDMVEELKLMVENKNINDLENNEDIKTFYQKRPEIYTTINEVLELSNQQGTFNKKYKIGDVSNWLVEEAKKNNLDLTNYSHNIDVSAVKHIKKQHGDIKTEEKRGQIAITDEDIKNIPYVINNPDYIILGTKNDRKQDSIIYVKNMDDGTSVYVEEVRDGRKTLTATTLFKRKKSLATADATSILKSLSLTSETPLGSIKIIPNPKSKVNKNNNTYLQTAFHGSPYSFDKFTLDHIGEGEGAQVHGYGLYFALDKNIAKNYRDFLSIKKRTGTIFEDTRKLVFDAIDFDEIVEKYFKVLDNEKKLHTSLKKRFYETELEKTLIRFTRENNYKTLEQKKLAMKNLIKTLKEENKNLTDEDTIEIPFQKVKKKEKNEYIIDILKYLLKQEAFKDNVPENEYTDRLYEVDIPEDYEMLREEIKLKEQPKEIQDKINKLFYDVENNNKNKNIKQLLKNYSTQDLSKARERVKELKEQLKQEKKNNNNNNTILKLQKQIEEQQNFIKYFYSPLVISQRELKQKLKEFDINNRTGKEIYEFISNFLYNFYRYDTRKNTSRLFNDYGIKGIRYNGREDGECAVVFDDKAISIIERYNQINNKNSSRNPTNSLNNKTTANIIIQTKKSKVKNNILSRNIIQDIINNKNKYIDNNLLIDNRNIDFKHNKDIKHFVFGNSYNNRTRFGLLVRQAVIENLKNILPKTNLILTKQDNGKHSGIDDWNYYEAKNIEIDGNLYNVVFDTYTTPNNNSTSYLYDFKIFRADNNQILTQQNNKDQKGQITFLKNQAIITLFNGKADQSTILHELAHYYLETIRRFANKDNPLAQHILEEVKEWTTSEAEVDPTYFMHERFARSYEYYIRTGKFKGKDHSNFMIEIFEYFKKFLESIYKTLSELNLDNNKIDKVKMEKFFDEYLFNPENFKNNTDYNVNKNDINNTNNTKNNTDNKDLASLILNQTIIGEFNEDLDNRINEYVKELKAEGGYDPRDIEEIVKWRFEDEITMATEAEINGWNTKLDTEANNIKFAKNVIKIAKDVAQEVIEKDTNTKITRKEQGEAIYKPLKEKQSIEQQTEFQKRFNARFNEELETQLLNNKEDNPLYPTTKETDNTLDPTAERNYLTVGEREILNNIKNAMGKIYSKQWKEQTNYNNKVLKDVNDRRAKLSQIAEEEGYESMKLKPYRNIEEALADSEYSKLDYRDKLKANYKNSQEQDFGITGNDYGLTLEEYQNIIDFRKRFINNRIDAIIENYETAKRTIEKNKDEILRRKRFETLALERMDEAKKQLKENNNLIDNLNKDLKLDIKQYREVLDNIGFFNELETKRRIIDYSQNHNIEDIKQYIENERLKLVKKQLKEDIRSVLGGVMHISKRTGEVYNNILYEDTGLFNDLIKISEYSRKKAKVELIKLTKNNESLSENNNSIINPELLNRQNEVIEPIEVIDYFKDKETSKDITLKEVMEIIDSTVRKNENGVRILNNENTNEAVTLASKSIDKMISSTIAQTDNNIGGILGKTCIANIKNLFAKSTFIMETQDIKHNSKNKIRRYATAIKSRGETFIVKFTVKEITNGRKELTDIELQNNGGKDLSLYDLKVSKKEVAESTSSDKSEAISNDTITINNLIEFVKRDDEKYFKEMTSQGPRFREDDSSSDNQEPLSHTKLKQRLLYFMANDIIDTKETTDLLTKLGRLVKESKQKLQQLQDENKGKITEESKTLELAIKNNKLSKGKLNLNSLTQGYLGNLPTLFTYIANKEMANKFDYSEKEKMFDVNYQTKMNKLLGNMETIAGGENKAKELYKSWNETIIDKETGKPLKLILTTKDSQGELIHKTFEMKDSLDTLAKRLSDDLLEQTDKKAFVETSISFLDRIKNITPERGGGFKYKYELTKYEYDKLSNIIDNTTKEFKEDNKNIKLINDFKNSNVVKFDPIPPYEINTWNLMQFYLQSKNKQTRKLIEKYYSHYYQKLDDLVKQQDKEFFEVAELLFKAVQDINELNPYHMLVKNRPMGRVDNYFPRVSIHQDELSIFDMFNNETPREQQMTALNTRTFNAIPNLAVNPLVLASRHIMQTEYLKNIAVPLKKAILIVKKPSIQKAIEESKGIDIKNAVVEHLDELKYTYNQATVELDNMIRYFIGNWAKAKTNTLSVFLKQFTSFIPYMENIDNKKNYMKNFLLKGLIHPVDTFNWMMEHSPYARTRIEDKPFDYILEEIKNDKNREQPIIDFFKNFNDILRKYTGLDKIKITLPKLGDTLSVVYGGYARIQTLMQNGMTEEQAIKDFEKQTIETQQSEYSSLTPRSRLKHRVNSTPSKLAKMFTSQNAQYFQKFLQHYNNYFNGNIKKAEFYSYITLYHIILPLVMTVVNDTLIAGIFGKKDKNWWEHTKDFLGFTLLSFAPLDLLGQAVVLDSGKIIEKLFKKPYELFVDAGETITGLPISSYWRMFFKRYYKSIFDFYDTEETKKKKEKREENKKNKKRIKTK